MELTPNLHAFLWTSPAANNCNTYLVRSAEKAILVDPGHAAYFDHVRQGLGRLGLSRRDIDLIVCTHAHPDHIEAVRLFEGFPARFAVHEAEWQQTLDMAPYLRTAMAFDPDRLAPDFFLAEGKMNVGDIALEVVHTPGHSPGAVTLYWPAEKALFTGDLVFENGVGRTDLPGGHEGQLTESLHRVAALDADWLLSGHGNVLSGADAVRANFEQLQWMGFGTV